MGDSAYLAWRVGMLCALMSVVYCQATDRAPKSIFGSYGQHGTGRDSIRVSENASGKINVAVKLYYSNGHTCQLNKEGEWSEDHVAIIGDGLETSRPCRLNLFFENDRVRLKDEGLQCTPVYCGTRGKLDNISLPRFSPNRK